MNRDVDAVDVTDTDSRELLLSDMLLVSMPPPEMLELVRSWNLEPDVEDLDASVDPTDSDDKDDPPVLEKVLRYDLRLDSLGVVRLTLRLAPRLLRLLTLLLRLRRPLRLSKRDMANWMLRCASR